jgi:hypothetical protein
MNCEDNNGNGNGNGNSIDMMNDWRLKSLYIDTEHLCAAKTDDEIITSDRLLAHQYRPQTHPSSVPVILKDTTRPYTYYTMKSYGHAQEHNYYVNFDDRATCINSNGNSSYGNATNEFETEPTSNVTFENSGCVKTYLCSLLGCFACCLFQFKPI